MDSNSLPVRLGACVIAHLVPNETLERMHELSVRQRTFALERVSFIGGSVPFSRTAQFLSVRLVGARRDGLSYGNHPWLSGIGDVATALHRERGFTK